MVYFTCDVCGESIKKKQIAKHCQTTCPNAWYFTCIDCNKVFEGFEYDKHTSCMTETERYAGKFLMAKAQKKADAKSAAATAKVEEEKATAEASPSTEEDEATKAEFCKYLIDGKEWMGWKRTIRHVLQDEKEGTMKLESLWKLLKGTFEHSSIYQGETKEEMRAMFMEKVHRPRFELVKDDKYIKLKPRK